MGISWASPRVPAISRLALEEFDSFRLEEMCLVVAAVIADC